MVTICCMDMGNYLGRGAEYANKLARACWRYAPKHDFVCFTDHPDAGYDRHINVVELDTNLPGFWAKLCLFRVGVFPKGEQVLYLDLDVVIHDSIAPMLELASNEEPALWILDDWEFPLQKKRLPESYPDGVTEEMVTRVIGNYGTCNSSVMMFRDDCAYVLWDDFSSVAAQGLHGDQNWINRRLGPDGFKLIPDGHVASYKFGGTGSILAFHGTPRPHEVDNPWMRRHWR